MTVTALAPSHLAAAEGPLPGLGKVDAITKPRTVADDTSATITGSRLT